MKFPESTFLKAAHHIQSTETIKVKLKGLTRVHESKFASIDVSLQKKHSFGDKNKLVARWIKVHGSLFVSVSWKFYGQFL